MNNLLKLDLNALLVPLTEEESRQVVGGYRIPVPKIKSRGSVGGGIWGPDNEAEYGV